MAPSTDHQRRYSTANSLQGGLMSFDATMREFLRYHRTALPLARPYSAITRLQCSVHPEGVVLTVCRLP